jgi:hypothetical protein
LKSGLKYLIFIVKLFSDLNYSFPKNRFKAPILILIVCCIFKTNVYSQIGLSERYQFNYLAINPAFAGETGPFGIKVVTENQLSGGLFFNKINTQLSLDGQLYGQTGLAFQAYRTNSGNLLTSGLNIDYAKGIERGELKAKVGLNTGLSIIPNLATLNNQTRLAGFLGLGALLKYKEVYAGASQPVLLKTDLFFEPLYRYFMMGYFRNNLNEKASFHTNIILQTEGKDIFPHFNASFMLNRKIGAGISYRKNDDFIPFEKLSSIYPFIKLNVSDKMQMGLGYTQNPFNSSVGTGINNSLLFSSTIQFYIRYINKSDEEESWFNF